MNILNKIIENKKNELLTIQNIKKVRNYKFSPRSLYQSLKGKETRGERRKQIIKSRQGQRKKVKSINNPRS